MFSAKQKRVWITGGSIAALILGFVLGMAAHASGDRMALSAAGALSVVGTLWINALRMTVVPLVVAQLVASLVGSRGGAVGRIGVVTVVTFAVMLATGGMITATAAPAMFAWLPLQPEALAAVRALPSSTSQSPQPVAGFATWLVGLVPANPLRAIVQDDLLGVMIFAIAFGLAVRGMNAERRNTVGELSRIAADAMMTIIGWVMWVMPIAVFSLALTVAARGGLDGAQVLLAFVVLVCALLLACTLLLYPVGAFATGLPIWRFASAIMPAQLVAVSSRSSIASLPAMVDVAANRLAARPEASSFVLPLAVSSFKLNRMISPPFQFLFLAHVYGIDLSTAQIVGFMTASVILSLTTLGIPSGGSQMRTAPLYAAAGIPLEGYLLVEAVDAIPDMFKTVLNVTANLTALSVVNRWTRSAAAVGAAAAPAVERAAASV